MQGGDRGLRLVLAKPVACQRGLQDGHALGDQPGVPARAVLPVERDETTVGRRPRGAPGVVQQHQGEEPGDFRLVGQCRELPGDPDRLGRQIHVAAVALVEDEVEHPQHHCEVTRLIQRLPGQAALGAADPLCHRRLGNEVGARDLRRRQAADRAQGQRDRRLGRQGWARAQEVQRERVVDVRHRAGRRLGVHDVLAHPACRLRPRVVEEPVPRRGYEPPFGIARRVVGPGSQRAHERLLHGVLGRREVRSAPDEDANHRGHELPQQRVVHSPVAGG